MEAAAGPGTEPHSNVFVRNLPGASMSWQALALIHTCSEPCCTTRSKSPPLQSCTCEPLASASVGVPHQFHVFRSLGQPSNGSTAASGTWPAAWTPIARAVSAQIGLLSVTISERIVRHIPQTSMRRACGSFSRRSGSSTPAGSCATPGHRGTASSSSRSSMRCGSQSPPRADMCRGVGCTITERRWHTRSLNVYFAPLSRSCPPATLVSARIPALLCLLPAAPAATSIADDGLGLLLLPQ